MLKRHFDILASLIGLILFSPLLLIIGVLVKATSEGPIFYRANRVGRFGKPFKLYKFRSMVVDADKIGPGVTGAVDPRITSVGRFLRKTKLDELPQLINVFGGDMSMVGPRPEDPRYVALYTDEQRRVLTVRPGITSPASVRYRDEEAMLIGDDWEKHYIEIVMPAKLVLDVEYAQNSTFWRDLALILVTLVRLVFRRKDA